jgi:hypothetical protein
MNYRAIRSIWRAKLAVAGRPLLLPTLASLPSFPYPSGTMYIKKQTSSVHLLSSLHFLLEKNRQFPRRRSLHVIKTCDESQLGGRASSQSGGVYFVRDIHSMRVLWRASQRRTGYRNAGFKRCSWQYNNLYCSVTQCSTVQYNKRNTRNILVSEPEWKREFGTHRPRGKDNTVLRMYKPHVLTRIYTPKLECGFYTEFKKLDPPRKSRYHIDDWANDAGIVCFQTPSRDR